MLMLKKRIESITPSIILVFDIINAPGKVSFEPPLFLLLLAYDLVCFVIQQLLKIITRIPRKFRITIITKEF